MNIFFNSMSQLYQLSSNYIPSAQPSISRSKERRRTNIDDTKKQILEKYFSSIQFPTAPEKGRLAIELGLSTKSIQIWFQNRRQKKICESRSNTGTEKYTDLLLLAEAAMELEKSRSIYTLKSGHD